MSYDAILLTSFGGPEGPEEVMPYLERVTAGRGIPKERLVEVSHHYMALGGVSPINDQNRALLAKLKSTFQIVASTSRFTGVIETVSRILQMLCAKCSRMATAMSWLG